MTLFGRQIAVRVILIALAVVLLVIGAGVYSCQRKDVAETSVRAETAEGRSESGSDAIRTLDDLNARIASSEAQGADTADIIRNTEGADDALHPDLNRAALERVCLRAAYRGTPACQRLLADGGSGE